MKRSSVIRQLVGQGFKRSDVVNALKTLNTLDMEELSYYLQERQLEADTERFSQNIDTISSLTQGIADEVRGARDSEIQDPLERSESSTESQRSTASSGEYSNEGSSYTEGSNPEYYSDYEEGESSESSDTSSHHRGAIDDAFIQKPVLETGIAENVLSESEIALQQLRMIQRVSEVLNRTEYDTMELLRAYEWRENELIDEYYKNARFACEKANIKYIDPLEPVPVKKEIVIEEGEICEVCMEEYKKGDELFVLDCGHYCCKSCWKDYLTKKIEEGKVFNIKCVAYECNEIVPSSMVEKIVDGKTFERYMKFISRSFVEDNPSISWCPAPGCDRALYPHNVHFGNIKCDCGYRACYKCKGEPHGPATCEQVKKWKKRLKSKSSPEDSETERWIRENTRICPACKTRIEKNNGCNHMTCRCGYEFCWVCLGPWSGHTDYYHCNRFDEKRKNEKELLKFGIKDPEEIERFEHYKVRYLNHNNSLKYDLKKYEAVREDLRNMKRSDPRYKITKAFYKALDILVDNRYALKYSYVFGYYNSKGAIRDLFEFLQKDLEFHTEELSYLLNHFSHQSVKEIYELAKTANMKRVAMLEALEDVNKDGSFEKYLVGDQDGSGKKEQTVIIIHDDDSSDMDKIKEEIALERVLKQAQRREARAAKRKKIGIKMHKLSDLDKWSLYIYEKTKFLGLPNPLVYGEGVDDHEKKDVMLNAYSRYFQRHMKKLDENLTKAERSKRTGPSSLGVDSFFEERKLMFDGDDITVVKNPLLAGRVTKEVEIITFDSKPEEPAEVEIGEDEKTVDVEKRFKDMKPPFVPKKRRPRAEKKAEGTSAYEKYVLEHKGGNQQIYYRSSAKAEAEVITNAFESFVAGWRHRKASDSRKRHLGVLERSLLADNERIVAEHKIELKMAHGVKRALFEVDTPATRDVERERPVEPPIPDDGQTQEKVEEDEEVADKVEEEDVPVHNRVREAPDVRTKLLSMLSGGAPPPPPLRSASRDAPGVSPETPVDASPTGVGPEPGLKLSEYTGPIDTENPIDVLFHRNDLLEFLRDEGGFEEALKDPDFVEKLELIRADITLIDYMLKDERILTILRRFLWST